MGTKPRYEFQPGKWEWTMGRGGPCMLTYRSFRDTCPSISAVHHIKGEETQHTTLVHNGRCQFTTGQYQMLKIYSVVTGVCHQGVDTSTVGFFDEWMEEYFAIYLAYANGVTQKSSQYVVLIYIYFTVWLPGQRACNWLGSNYTKVLYNNIQLQKDRRTEGQKDRIESCPTP